MAAFCLPLVYAGLIKDFWKRFDRYIKIEKGLPSTFFIIPRKMDAGTNVQRPSSWKRAAKYDVQDVGEQLGQVASAGDEIALHGIDAWHNVEKGIDERQRVAEVAKLPVSGVRMHWLCFNEYSPVALDQAGFTYDSTMGYNETIGYRAGTGQVFKSPQAEQLLELPLHIMDTALFYPAYLNLSPTQAKQEMARLIQNASRFGGILTVNWHDRSIAPERLWQEPYVELLDELKKERAWFATGSQCVSWFRKRRSAMFENGDAANGPTEVKVSPEQGNDGLPGLRLRVHKSETEFVDTVLNDSTNAQLESFRAPQSAVRTFQSAS